MNEVKNIINPAVLFFSLVLVAAALFLVAVFAPIKNNNTESFSGRNSVPEMLQDYQSRND